MANKGVEGVVPLSGRSIERPTTRSGRARRVGWYAGPCSTTYRECELRAGRLGRSEPVGVWSSVGGAKTDGMVAVVGEGPGEEAGL